MPNAAFKDKWGKIIDGEGHTQIPNLLIVHAGELGMKPSEFMLIICILKHAWKLDNGWPSHAQLGKYMAMSESQIKRLIKQVEKKGFIEKVRRGPRSTNNYRLSPLIPLLKNSFIREVENDRKRLNRKERNLSVTGTDMDP